MKNKIFTRIIITTLLVTFLTFNVGRVTRVSAMGATIAAASGAALLTIGMIYCSYMALTNASFHVPEAVDDLHNWLTDVGTKVVQYPSGRAAYEEIYPDLISRSPAGTLIHDLLDSEVWTWTAEKLKDWANDFSSTDVISDIVSYSEMVHVDGPTNGFDYPFEFNELADSIDGTDTFESYQAIGYTFTWPDGCNFIIYSMQNHAIVNTWNTGTVRNVKHSNGTFGVEQLVNGTWQTISSINDSIHMTRNGRTFFVRPDVVNLRYSFYNFDADLPVSQSSPFPMLPNEVIYDEVTEQDLPMVIPDSLVTYKPQWPTLPPDDDNKPVIPYVKLPFDPNWIDPITNLPTGGGNWGFNLGSLLDLLEDLAGAMMEIGAIGELINQFKDLISGQSGDEYYIYYDDSEHNETFYQYYTITNYNGDVYQYDIDVSDADEHLPVDLNTISTYTQNRYLTQIKESAIAGSSMLRDLAVFWYDVDPEVTFIVLGCCILILVGAFTGKLGHS